jgi:ribosomal protein L11 methyltransferase
MKWAEYTIDTTLENVDRVLGILTDLGLESFEVKDQVPLSAEDEKKMFTDIPAELPASDKAQIIFYSSDDPDALEAYSTGSSIRDADNEPTFIENSVEKTEAEVNALLDERFQASLGFTGDPGSGNGRPALKVQIRDDSEWKDKYKEVFVPFRVSGDIVIKPAWVDHTDIEKDGDHVITLDPGAGFGTGMHETTQLCLINMEKFLQKGALVLDVGCGSGILGIAALLKGADYAVMVDIDELAVEGIDESMELNGISKDRYMALKADFLQEEALIAKRTASLGRADLVFANILADIVIPLSGIIGKFMKDGAYLISSGILTDRAEEVIAALESNGFTIVERTEKGEWTGLASRKL